MVFLLNKIQQNKNKLDGSNSENFKFFDMKFLHKKFSQSRNFPFNLAIN